jgi:hypothetical protein
MTPLISKVLLIALLYLILCLIALLHDLAAGFDATFDWLMGITVIALLWATDGWLEHCCRLP